MAIDRNKISKLAETYMATGRVERAIEEYLKLLEDRTDDNLMNRVGDAYLQAGKLNEALDLFKKAGSGYERSGFNSKATAVLKKAHRVAPEDMEISERLAELYRQTNMIKEAIQIHIEVADVCTRKGLIKRALEEFAKVVDLDPKNLKNKVKLADLYNKEGMKDRAANIYLDVAEALSMEQMHSEAGQILERAKTMVSTPQVFLTQSRLCVIQKDLSGAAEHLREGLGLNPRSAELLDALAEVELQARSPERALEALAQVPQLPEKSLALCERAMRDLVRAGKSDDALRLFKPIGREFARRGLGEAAAKAVRTGLQGVITVDAWVLLAEIAHQSGNRAEHVECLRHAHAEAQAKGDELLAETLAHQLQSLGLAPEQLKVPFVPASGPSRHSPTDSRTSLDNTEIDPLKRMQIQQLEREAENSVRNRFTDRALEGYGRILELEPNNPNAIQRIADIYRASGVLTKVQMHLVKTAERIAPMGFRHQAAALLDQAEALFPGSTRLYRRNLGLVDLPPAPAAPARSAPVENVPIIELEDPRRSSVPPPQFGAMVPPKPEELFQLPIAGAQGAAPGTDSVPAWETLGGETAPAEPWEPKPGQASAPWEAPTEKPGTASWQSLPEPPAAAPWEVLSEAPATAPWEALPEASEAAPWEALPTTTGSAPWEAPPEATGSAPWEALPEATGSAPWEALPEAPAAAPWEALPEAPAAAPWEALPEAPAAAPWEALPEPPAAAPWEAVPEPPAPLAEDDFTLPPWEALPEPPPAPAAEPSSPPEYEWSEINSEITFPPLELEPLPFPTGPKPIDEELQNTLSDIDFQLDYGSPEEAKIEIEAALRDYPNHPELNQRLAQADDALSRLGHAAESKPAQDSFNQSFFDLTDVLGDALLESGDGEEMHDATHVVEKIQSVDELFNAFREGVEQQVKGDDYETHYNLGIAYKEMMLLEPAVEEFKKAMVDPERTLECCSMLSICEQVQGNLDRAITWLNQGIQAPGFPPEDAIGLRYDLGNLLLQQGRGGEAQEQFRMVYDQDPEYREVDQLLAH